MVSRNVARSELYLHNSIITIRSTLLAWQCPVEDSEILGGFAMAWEFETAVCWALCQVLSATSRTFCPILDCPTGCSASATLISLAATTVRCSYTQRGDRGRNNVVRNSLCLVYSAPRVILPVSSKDILSLCAQNGSSDKRCSRYHR